MRRVAALPLLGTPAPWDQAETTAGSILSGIRIFVAITAVVAAAASAATATIAKPEYTAYTFIEVKRPSLGALVGMASSPMIDRDRIISLDRAFLLQPKSPAMVARFRPKLSLAGDRLTVAVRATDSIASARFSLTYGRALVEMYRKSDAARAKQIRASLKHLSRLKRHEMRIALAQAAGPPMVVVRTEIKRRKPDWKQYGIIGAVLGASACALAALLLVFTFSVGGRERRARLGLVAGLVVIVIAAAASRGTALAVLALGVAAGALTVATWWNRASRPADAAPVPLRSTFARTGMAAGLATLGLLLFRLPFGLTISDLCIVSTIGVILVTKSSPTRPLPSALVAGAAAYTIGAAISTYGALSVAESLQTLLRVLMVTIVVPWTLLQLVQSRDDIRRGVTLWCISAAVAGYGALPQLFAKEPLFPGAQVIGGRYSGLTGHINDLGGVCAIALIPACALVVERHGLRKAVPLLIVVIGIVIGVVLSGSVGSWLATAAGLVAWAIMTRPRPRVVISVGAVTAVGLVIITLLAGKQFATPWHRIAVSTTSNDPVLNTLAERNQIAQAAWHRIEEHPLVGTGLGFGNSSTHGLSASGLYVHNLLLGAWDSGGLVAFAGMCLIVSSMFASCSRLWRQRHSIPLVKPAIATAAAFITLSMSSPIVFQRYAWIAMWLTLVLERTEFGSPTGKIGQPVRGLTA